MLKIFLLKNTLAFFTNFSSKNLHRLAYILGFIFNQIPSRRRWIIDVNLAHCFPDLSKAVRKKIRNQNITHILRSILERGILWLGSHTQINELVQLHGRDHLEQALANNRPIILMGMHNVGLEAAVYRIAADADWQFAERFANIYMPHKNPLLENWLHKTRQRFGCLMFSKKDSAKQLIKHLNKKFYQGAALLNINADMDFGEKGAYYIPFFRREAATVANTLRLAVASNAIIIPFYAIYDMEKFCYHSYIQAPLQAPQTPSAHLHLNDVQLTEQLMDIHQNLEKIIMQDMTQYWWVHRRFKTQRDGQNIYKKK